MSAFAAPCRSRDEVAVEASPMSSITSSSSGERIYFGAAALGLIGVTIAGFSAEADLIFHLDTLSWLVLLHSALMFGWLILFAIQTSLVAVGRVALHRRMGIAGCVMAIAIVLVGFPMVIIAARLGGDHMPPDMPAPVFLASAFSLLIIFSVLVAFGIGLRRQRDYHKRLMLLATIPLLDAAIVRFMNVYTHWTFDSNYIRYGLIFICVLIDTIRCRRLHPAFVAGCAFILFCDELSAHLPAAPLWTQFTEWMTT
jgi:hypothetical protein